MAQEVTKKLIQTSNDTMSTLPASRTLHLIGLLLIAMAAPASAAERRAPKPPAAAERIVASPVNAGTNLIRNGKLDFHDAGAEGPANWQQMDNLVWHWTRDPKAPERGKVLLVDTDVNQGQAYEWWTRRYLDHAPLAQAPQKQATVAPKYDTIAGLDGGFFWSDYIPVKPGGAYRVTIDAKGPASKVFIRGYEKKLPLFFADEVPAVQGMFRRHKGEPETDESGRPVRYRLRYRYQTWFAVGGAEQWKTYTHEKPRHPNSREITEDVRWIRITLYPYWPPGRYWYDNIRVVEMEPDGTQAMPDAEEADLEEGKVVR